MNTELCALLREYRPKSWTIEAAVGSPAQVGEIEVCPAEVCGHTSLWPRAGVQLTDRTARVPVRTLDSILEESGLSEIDFLSLDVEGMELDVLLGYDLAKWRPQLILVEDGFENYAKHRRFVAVGYKLVWRTGYNNWYVPKDASATFFSLSSTKHLIRLYRKMWLGPMAGMLKTSKQKLIH